MRDVLKQLLTYFLIVSILHLGLVTSASAALVATDQIGDWHSAANEARAQIEAFVVRSDVVEQISGMGVSVTEALARVRAMTDDEALSAAGRIKDLPAGGDGLGTLIGAAVFVFIVLLITDILGLTKVFPFTKPIKR